MAEFRFPPVLSTAAWEAEFTSPAGRAGAGDGGGPHLDFGRVEYVEFGVLARALLVLDAAVAAGVGATVTLPAHELERSWTRAGQTRHRAGRRGQARAFMRQAGFQEAPHWPADAVRVRGAGEREDKGEDIDETPTGQLGAARADQDAEPVGYRRRLLPLQWLQPLEGAGVRGAARYVSVEQGLGDLGLAASDARAIGETVLAELIGAAAKAAAARDPRDPRVLVGGQLLDLDCPPRLGEPTAPAPPASAAQATGRVLRLFAGSGGRFSPAADGPLSDVAVFEATVPVGPRFAAPDGHWSGHPALHRPHRLGWVGCSLGPDGLPEADRAAFRTAVNRTREGAGGSGARTSGVVVTVSMSADTQPEPGFDPAAAYGPLSPVRRAVARAIETLAQGAQNAAVAAVFPDLGWHVVESCVAGLEEKTGAAGDGAGRAARAQHDARPVLVLGAQGRPRWFGGPAPLRAVLELLTEAGGVVSVTDAKARWTLAGGAADEFERAQRAYRHLIAVEDGSVLLLLSPLHVLSALRDAAQGELGGAIARGSAGVRLGAFRAPTLGVTNRWIDAGRLLEGTTGPQVAAFTLARAVQARLAALPPSRAPVVVARTHGSAARTAGLLSECLALGERTFPAGPPFDQGGWPAVGEVPRNARVVVYTDVVLTENTVRRAIADIARHAEPAVVACVVDARAERGPIRVLNRQIPVVALVEADILTGRPDAACASPDHRPGYVERTTPGERTSLTERTVELKTRMRPVLVDIDPFTSRPAEPRSPRRLPISEEELLYWCEPQPEAPSGALRLGHVEYARRVHAGAAIDVNRLLRREGARARITDAIADAVQRGLARVHHRPDSAAEDGALQLWYPGDPRDNAGRLAHAAWARLTTSGYRVQAPHAFPYIGGGAPRLTAPAPPERGPRPRTVVVLDYAARTGTTLRQMILNAVRLGAERVVAVVLLDLLPEFDRGMLGSVSAVSADVGGARDGRSGDVPISVRYLSAASVAGVGSDECGLCATREKYAGFAEAPDRLRRHAERLHAQLRPRHRDDLFESASEDLFGVPLLGEDATDYLRWRGLLQRALHDTSTRQEVVDRLGQLDQAQTPPDAEWGRRGLTRLLAAEQSWLNLPPLHFTDARELLARCCLDELDNLAPESPWLRAQAVMVLAAAAPDRFAGLLPELVGLGADEPVVIDQLCLEAYRFAVRSRQDAPVDRVALRSALMRCRDALDGGYLDGLDLRRAAQYAHVVRQLIFLTDRPVRPTADDPREAWAQLAERWCRPPERHRFESRLLRVRDFVEDLQIAEPTREQTDAAEADLRECARLAEERVLAYLPPLREILAGDHAAGLLGRRSRQRFAELATTDAAGLPALSQRLNALVREPRSPDDSRWRAARRELLDQIGWWYHALFATQRPYAKTPAQLVELVRSAPASVGEVVALEVAARGLDGATKLAGDLDVPVFCPRDLLGEAVGHVLDTVSGTGAVSGALPVAVSEDYPPDSAGPRFEFSLRRPCADAVQLVLRSAGPPPDAAPRRAMTATARALQPYGAWLAAGAVRADGSGAGPDAWTFESVIALRPWQGA